MLNNEELRVPFFRPSISEAAMTEVVACLRSGWLTTGPRTKQFEREFAEQVGAKHAVAVNSCTAALHLSVEALGLQENQAVLVPTMTFAATAEVVRYQNALPILVDCDPVTLQMDLNDAEAKLNALRNGQLPLPADISVVGIMPVHVGGSMLDVDAVKAFATRHGLWVVEDAAHAFPAAYLSKDRNGWVRCGENTAAATCYSFYSNKTITTGEGGMVVTDDEAMARHMQQMSLHGLSNDAWRRFSGSGSWDYQIMDIGYKYNMTDIAAALGIHQLQQATEMQQSRQAIAMRYLEELADQPSIELPLDAPDRRHAWHLFPLRLRQESMTIDRGRFIEELRKRGVGSSVHWRPLHLHPYYQEVLNWQPEHCPVASAVWKNLVSLPLFPGMQPDDQLHVLQSVKDICREFAKHPRRTSSGNVEPSTL